MRRSIKAPPRGSGAVFGWVFPVAPGVAQGFGEKRARAAGRRAGIRSAVGFKVAIIAAHRIGLEPPDCLDPFREGQAFGVNVVVGDDDSPAAAGAGDRLTKMFVSRDKK
jgi:hypothetical protein